MTSGKSFIKAEALHTSQVLRPSLKATPPRVSAPAKSILTVQSSSVQDGAGPAKSTSPVDAAELERIKAQARQEGLALGRAQGQAEADKVLREKLSAVDGLVKALEQSLEEHMQRSEQTLVDFAFIVVGRVLGDAMQNPDAIASSVRAALAACGAWDQVTLEVHPRDMEILKLALAPEADRLQKTLRFSASSAVKLGGCRVVLDDGMLDARLEVQLAQLHESLTAARDQWAPQDT